MIKLCSAPSCIEKSKSKIGYCLKHYARFKRNGHVELIVYETVCKNCGNSSGKIRKGYCDNCYRCNLRTGIPNRTNAAKGQGTISVKGYKVYKKNGKRYYAHREIIGAKPGEVVHHKDGNRLNNTIENLELFGSIAEHTKHHWKERSSRHD